MAQHRARRLESRQLTGVGHEPLNPTPAPLHLHSWTGGWHAGGCLHRPGAGLPRPGAGQGRRQAEKVRHSWSLTRLENGTARPPQMSLEATQDSPEPKPGRWLWGSSGPPHALCAASTASPGGWSLIPCTMQPRIRTEWPGAASGGGEGGCRQAAHSIWSGCLAGPSCRRRLPHSTLLLRCMQRRPAWYFLFPLQP